MRQKLRAGEFVVSMVSIKADTPQKFYDDIHKIHGELWDYWVQNTFLKWDFWVSFTLIVLSWSVFFFFRKRDSTARLFLVILYMICITSWLDFLGIIMGMWYYTGDVFPTIPSFIVWDFSVLPIFSVMMLQYKPNVHPVWKALVYSGICAFIGEPIFTSAHFYVMVHWSFFYSFLIHFVLYLIAHKISRAKSFEPLASKGDSQGG